MAAFHLPDTKNWTTRGGATNWSVMRVQIRRGIVFELFAFVSELTDSHHPSAIQSLLRGSDEGSRQMLI
jgi:hypothetical protein